VLYFGGMLLVGAHTSSQGGVENALYRGQEIGATTIQLFTSNQKQWKGRVIDEEMVERWNVALEETGIQKVMSHDSYLINLGSPRSEILEKSRKAFAEELERCHALNLSYLNFHPGAALTSSEEECLNLIAKSLLGMEKLAAKGDTILLLEATAGQGTNVGHRFEHLAAIIEQVKGKVPIGVCIDTCHIFAAGYDIRNKKAWDATLKEFDQVVGLKYLHALHVNDSKKGLGSRVDRHDHLGEGEIGMEAFKVMMTHPKLRKLPKYLETPLGEERWVDEIKQLRKFAALSS
jgi:deoxyribonuclease IV